MNYSIGTKIIWVADMTGEEPIKEGTITKESKDLIWVDNWHKPEDCISKPFVWPFEAKAELQQTLTTRKALKAQFDNSMTLVYQLSNKYRAN